MHVQQKKYVKLQTNTKCISFPTMITPLMFNGIYSTEQHVNNYIYIISSSNTYLLIRTINH